MRLLCTYRLLPKKVMIGKYLLFTTLKGSKQNKLTIYQTFNLYIYQSNYLTIYLDAENLGNGTLVSFMVINLGNYLSNITNDLIF